MTTERAAEFSPAWVKAQTKTLCRWCERDIWLFTQSDGSWDPDIWTADDETITCHSAPLVQDVQTHKPIGRKRGVNHPEDDLPDCPLCGTPVAWGVGEPATNQWWHPECYRSRSEQGAS